MKQCSDCNETKPFTEFFKDKGFKDGHYSRCKVCKTKATMQWRAENTGKYNESARNYNKKHYEKLRLNRYDITEEQYKAMLVAQDHKCAIPGCGKTATKKRKLAIDHCHKTDKVRGLLCYGCNRAMHAVDDMDKLNLLIEYRDKDRNG